MHRSLRLTALALVLAVSFNLAHKGPSTAYADTITFTVTGKGWGHGIGLSQYGAKGYAEAGWGYKKILQHYYGGHLNPVVTVSPRIISNVMVNLDDAKAPRTSWVVRPGSEYSRLVVRDPANTANNVSLPAKDARGRWNNYVVTTSGSKVIVRLNSVSGSVLFPKTPTKYGTAEIFSSTPPSSVGEPGLVWIVSTSGPWDNANRRWRGRVRFVPTSATASKAINVVDMQGYLYGVVPRESPSSWHLEALKAQAVAARSYAYDSVQSASELYCTTRSQVYGGHSYMKLAADGTWSPVRTSLGYTGGEAVRSNSAVAATYNATTRGGEVVVYGTTVVKTFFSSSSGGHTANIEDVWLSSTPRPYYRGIEDADGPETPLAVSWGNPLVYSNAAFAAKVRAKDASDGDTVNDGISSAYNYSPSSTAITLVNVVPVRTANGSGHARTVRLYWSNGSVTQPAGDWIRNALGLKSTKFSVRRTIVYDVRRYEETSPLIRFVGSWYAARGSIYSGGAYKYSKATGGTFSASFKGTAIKWIGPKYPAFGRANVYLDGRYARTVSQYSASPLMKQVVWSATGLSADTTHTVTVKVTGTKDAASKGYYVGLDALDVTSGGLVSH